MCLHWQQSTYSFESTILGRITSQFGISEKMEICLAALSAKALCHLQTRLYGAMGLGKAAHNTRVVAPQRNLLNPVETN